MNEEDRNNLRELQRVWKVLYTCLSVTIVSLNCLVILIFAFMSKLRSKIPNYLLFIQASVDLCYGIKITLDLIPAYQSTYELAMNRYYNITKTFLGDMITYIAIGNLIMTSVERYIALHKPLYHRRSVTRCKIICGTVILVIMSTIPSGVFAYMNDPIRISHFDNSLLGFYIFDNSLIIGGIIVVLTVLIMTYYTIHQSVKTKVADAKSNLDTNLTKSRHYLNTILAEHKKDSRVIRLFLTIALVYMVTYLPTCIFNIITKCGGGQDMTYISLLRLQISLFALHCAPAVFNPMLTIVLKHDFQDPMKRYFTKRVRYLRGIPNPQTTRGTRATMETSRM